MIKRLIIVLMLPVLVAYSAKATLRFEGTDAADSSIVYLEYFFNTDPGFGNGVPIPVTPSGNIQNLSLSLDISMLNNGFNHLYVRAKDESNYWSMTGIKSFYKEVVFPQAADIVYLEYFMDSDPGFGNGTEIPLTKNQISGLDFVTDITNYADGFHHLYFRAKDANGLWSMTAIKSIFKETVYPENANIVFAEYFLDTDPGNGNGVTIPVEPSHNLEALGFSVDISDIQPGFHHLYIRVRNENGFWSITGTKSFYKETIFPASSQITCLEYFLDVDPGFGNGTSIIADNVSLTDGLVFSVDISAAGNGFHHLYLRGKDEQGKWSMTAIKSFYKETVPSEIRNITKAEYFFNTDPGVGNGQPLALIPAPDISGLTFVAEVQNLPLGVNRLYVRAMDADGRWSLTNIHAFSVECSQVTVDFEVQNGCAGLPAEFVDLSTNTHPEAEYRWDFGDGLPILITGRGNVSHTYSQTGYFQAKLIVINRTDCIDSITHNITINNPPFVEAGANLTVCEGSEVVLNAVYEFGTLSWDHGVVNGVPFVPETSTTYTATVLSEFGCGSVTDPITVTVTENPQVFAGEDATGCHNEGFLISSAFVRNAASVIWETTNGSGYFDDAGIVNATYFPSPQDPQMVGLCLTALPLNPCALSATGCFNLLMSPAAWVTIETPTNGDTICAGTVLQLQAIAGNSASCLWSTSGDGVFGSPFALLTTYTPGQNDVIGQRVDLCIQCFPTLGCTIPATACITLQVSPDPVVVLEPEIWLDCADFDFDENQWLPVQLSAMPENVSSLFWTTTGDGYFSNPAHPETAYFIGENDALSNHVHLTVTASGAGLCGITDSESVNIYISKQMIPVEQAGWRGLSSFVDMSGQSLAEVLDPVNQHLLVIRDDQNRTYTPGTGVNTIGNWSATGYMANFKNPPACLPLYGEPVTNKIIHIGKQVTYLPVINDQPITIEELFAGHLEKIQSVYDWSTFKTWTPSNPTFHLLKPGFAYQLTLSNPDSDFHIEFPPYSWEDLPASLFISGKISNQESSEPVEGVEIVVSGQSSVFTNVDGIFQAAVPRNWSGTVSAIKPDWEFSPLSRNINNAVVNIFDQDFTGIDNSCNAGWSVVYTPSFHTLIIPLAAQPGIFGEQVEPNDFIGVFYTDDQNTEQCGGFAQWTGNGSIQVTAFGDDPYSPEKDGFAENEPIKWKIFSCSKSEYFSAHATYDPFMPQSSGIFENYGFSVLTSLQAQICQEFFFNQNWNDLSLFVSPFNPVVAEIFAQMENNLVIFKNLTSFYWPQNAINTVGNWDLNSGYVLKTSAPESIVVCGIPLVEHSLQYSTSQGYWRYLPVLSACAVNCDELFGPVAGKITIVKDLIGTSVWWPEMGIYSLSELHPGQAYEIKIKEDITITFPVCDAKAVASTVSQPNFTTSPWGDLAASPHTHTIAVPSEVAALLAKDAVVGVFDSNGNITGASEVTGKQSFTISVFGNDVATPETEGMEEGSPMFFQLFDPLSGNYFALEVTFDENLPQKGFFANQGLSAIKSLQATGIVNINKTNPELLVFPNPSGGLFDVSLKTPVNTHFPVLWEVHNCQGSMVAGGKTEGSDFVINLTYQPKGIYYLRIVTEGWQMVRKLVVQ